MFESDTSAPTSAPTSSETTSPPSQQELRGMSYAEGSAYLKPPPAQPSPTVQLQDGEAPETGSPGGRQCPPGDPVPLVFEGLDPASCGQDLDAVEAQLDGQIQETLDRQKELKTMWWRNEEERAELEGIPDQIALLRRLERQVLIERQKRGYKELARAQREAGQEPVDPDAEAKRLDEEEAAYQAERSSTAGDEAETEGTDAAEATSETTTKRKNPIVEGLKEGMGAGGIEADSAEEAFGKGLKRGMGVE